MRLHDPNYIRQREKKFNEFFRSFFLINQLTNSRN